MKLSVFVITILAIDLNIPVITGQSPNINNSISLANETRQKVRLYLSGIYVNDTIIENVDAILASATLNLKTALNKSFDWSTLTTKTTSISNRLLL